MSELLPNQEIQQKSGNFIFIKGKMGKKKDFSKIREIEGSLKSHIVLFQRNYFLHTESHIHLSEIIAKIDPFYITLFCVVLMKHSSDFYETKNLSGQK